MSSGVNFGTPSVSDASNRQPHESDRYNVLVVGNADDARPYFQAARKDRRVPNIVAFVPIERLIQTSAGNRSDIGNGSDICRRVERVLDREVVDEVLVATVVPSVHLNRISIACL